MCGISGVIALNPNNISLDKVKLLAIFNRSRGEDSFGIYINKIITKAAGYKGAIKVGDAFEVFHNYNLPKIVHPVVLMHNRAKTVGLSTLDNAHPFSYEHDGKKYIFMKNGTIKNIKELKEKYNIDDLDLIGETDSEALGLILVRHGWDVLSEYEGGCAFVLYNETDNVCYFWKGKSKHDSTVASEERPFNFYYNERKKTFIFSSLFETVKSVENLDPKKQQIQTLLFNTVTKLDCSNLELSIEAEIDRSHITYSYYSNSSAYGGGGAYGANYFQSQRNLPQTASQTTTTSKKEEKEVNPQNLMGNRIYYYNGLYYQNGHPLFGKYLVLNKTGVVLKKDNQVLVTDETLLKFLETDNSDVVEMIMVRGIWAKDEKAAEEIKNMGTTKNITELIYTIAIKPPNELRKLLHPEFLLYYNGTKIDYLILNGENVVGNTFPKFGQYLYYHEQDRVKVIKIK